MSSIFLIKMASLDMNESANALERIESVERTLGNKLEAMEKQVQEIYTALIGSSKFKQKGAMERLDALEDWRDKVEKKMNWLVGYAAGAGAIIAIVFEVVKEYLIKK